MTAIAKGAQTLYDAIRKEWDDRDNAPPTGLEAIEACRVMWTHETGQVPWNSTLVTSGNRYTWVRGKCLTVNPDRRWNKYPHARGWGELVHTVAHQIHERKNPKDRPHCKAQARIERRLQRLVLDKLIQ